MHKIPGTIRLKKVLIALVCGWITMWLAKKPIVIDAVYDTRFVWQMLFPILIATAWEPVYAYITGIGGLVFLFPFFEMPYRGWGNVLLGILYLILLLVCGHFLNGTKRSGKYYLVYLIYMAFYYIAMTILFASFMRFNSKLLPFNQFVSPMIVKVQTITIILGIFATAAFVKVLLSLPAIRGILEMDPLAYSEKNTFIFVITIIVTAGYFIVDQLFEMFYFGIRGLHISLLSTSFGTIIKLPIVFAVACMVCDAIIYNTMKNLESKQKVIELNMGLEQTVEERTQKLQTAYKELESFSYIVTHELKTPIREIYVYLDIMREDNFDVLAEQSRADIVSAQEVCSQTLDMIEKMMMYTKAGFKVLNLEKINMKHLVQECFNDVQKVNQPKRMILNMEDLPPLYADAFLLRLAIINVLGNSSKFSQTRDVTVLTVGYLHESEQTIYMFKDNGVGFDQELRHNVFELFARAHNNSEYGGNGIGLALVKRIVDRHGGRVEITGKLGEGCIVSFIFHNNVD